MSDNRDKEPIKYEPHNGVCPYHNKRDILIEEHGQSFGKIMHRINILAILSTWQCIILLGLCVLIYGHLFGVQPTKNIPVAYPAIHATLERIK